MISSVFLYSRLAWSIVGCCVWCKPTLSDTKYVMISGVFFVLSFGLIKRWLLCVVQANTVRHKICYGFNSFFVLSFGSVNRWLLCVVQANTVRHKICYDFKRFFVLSFGLVNRWLWCVVQALRTQTSKVVNVLRSSSETEPVINGSVRDSADTCLALVGGQCVHSLLLSRTAGSEASSQSRGSPPQSLRRTLVLLVIVSLHMQHRAASCADGCCAMLSRLCTRSNS